MGIHGRGFVPAAGQDWLLRFYDPFSKLMGIDTLHLRLLGQSDTRPGQRVLEIGCGTGNLSILAKRRIPGAEVTGIDPDPGALARARRKATRVAVRVRFDAGFAEQLPYPDQSFDRVLSSLMLHHVQSDRRVPALQEALRVLKPGGSLHLADFADARDHGGGLVARVFGKRHGSASQQAVLGLMRDAGFDDPRPVAGQHTILGPIAFYVAVRAGERPDVP